MPVLQPAASNEFTLELLPPHLEALYVRGEEIVRQSIATLNEVLGRLITLDTALIGGGFIIAKGEVLPFWGGVIVLCSLLVSLIAALWGIFPQSSQVDLSSVPGLEAIQKQDEDLMVRKKRSAIIASIALCVAFATGIGALMIKGSPQQSPPTIPITKDSATAGNEKSTSPAAGTTCIAHEAGQRKESATSAPTRSSR